MKRIAVPYQATLNILRDEGNSVSAAVGDVTIRLQPSLRMIAEYEKSLAPLRKEWNRLNRTPDSELRQLIDQQSNLLQELLERLAALERRAMASRSEIASQLDESQRRNAMRKAYQS